MITVTTTNGAEIEVNPEQVAAVDAHHGVTLYMAGGWKFEITSESYEKYQKFIAAMDIGGCDG